MSKDVLLGTTRFASHCSYCVFNIKKLKYTDLQLH